MPEGRLLAAADSPIGSELTADAASGSRTLQIDWAGPFPSGAGRVSINDTAYPYTTKPDDDNDTSQVLVLDAPGLAAAAAAGDQVVLMNGDQQLTHRIAYVDVGGDQPIQALVPHNLLAFVPEGAEGDPAGPYADPWPCTVTNGPVVELVDVEGRTPILDGSTLYGDLPDPAATDGVTAPAVSPTPVVSPGPASVVVTWTGGTATARIALLVTSDNSVPAPNVDPATQATLHTLDVSQPDFVATLSDKVSPVPATGVTYFALQAYNAGGYAAPSGWVPGTAGVLDPQFVNLLVGNLVANNVLTQAVQALGIQIGDDSWDSTGLHMPGALDVTRNGSGSSAAFYGIAELLATTIRGNLSILGVSNFLQGLLRLGNGVVDPQAAPTGATSWDSLTHNVDGTYTPRGLVPDGTGWRFTQSVYGGASQVANVNSSGVQTIGNYVATTFVPTGGVTKVGTSWFVLGRDYSGSRNGNWWVHVYNASWTKTGEFACQSWMNADTRTPSIGTDGTIVVIARSAGSNQHAYAETYTTAGTYTSRVDCGVWDTDLVGVYVGPALFTTTRIVIASKAGPRVFNATTGARVTADEWKTAGSGDVWGISFDGSVWHHLSAKTIWHYTAEPNTVSKDFAYTWYDANTGGAGTAESLPSPRRTYTVQRYSRTTITAPAPPDDGTVDGANAVRFYASPAAAGTLVLQATDTAAPWTTTAQVLATTGAAPPSTSGFAARPATAPGEFASTATDGSGVALTRLLGNGTVRMENKLKTGTATVASGTGGATTAVTFTTPFPAGVTPVIVTQANDVNLTNARTTVKSNTGFSVRYDRAAAGTYTFDWTAVAP